MGTTKRVAAKPAKKAKGAAGNGPVAPAAPAPALTLDALAEALEAQAKAFQERLATLPATAPFSQEILRTCLRLEKVAAACGKAAGTTYVHALAHHTKGGAFETGKIAVSFPVKGGGRSPSWKTEATGQARQREGLEHGLKTTLEAEARATVFAAAAQHTFDEKRYHEQVLAATTPGESKTSVEFTEGA